MDESLVVSVKKLQKFVIEAKSELEIVQKELETNPMLIALRDKTNDRTLIRNRLKSVANDINSYIKLKSELKLTLTQLEFEAASVASHVHYLFNLKREEVDTSNVRNSFDFADYKAVLGMDSKEEDRLNEEGYQVEHSNEDGAGCGSKRKFCGRMPPPSPSFLIYTNYNKQKEAAAHSSSSNNSSNLKIISEGSIDKNENSFISLNSDYSVNKIQLDRISVKDKNRLKIGNVNSNSSDEIFTIDTSSSSLNDKLSIVIPSSSNSVEQMGSYNENIENTDSLRLQSKIK